MRSECSHIRRTAHPSRRSAARTLRSLALFRLIFSDQKATLDFGILKCLGHPCQKQPSTNTATLRDLLAKSGFPHIPLGWARTRRPLSMGLALRSGPVSLERMRDMISDLVRGVLSISPTIISRWQPDVRREIP